MKKKINQKINSYFKRKKYSKLVRLFAKKSNQSLDLDTSCFFATQAYILSLECNNSLSEQLFIYLKKNNREE